MQGNKDRQSSDLKRPIETDMQYGDDQHKKPKHMESINSTNESGVSELFKMEQGLLHPYTLQNWKNIKGEVLADVGFIDNVYHKDMEHHHSRKITVLEVTQYLEKCLWPAYVNNYVGQNRIEKQPSKEHLLSIILLLNEKFDEGVDAWEMVAKDQEHFKTFFDDIIQLQQEQKLSIKEKTSYLLFLINTFQSLENSVVRAEVLKLVGFSLWLGLSPGRLKLELFENQDLVKVWKRLQKREAKERRDAEVIKSDFIPFKDRTTVKYIPVLIEDFLAILQQITKEDCGDSHLIQVKYKASIHYCERFVEFLIDLLSQLPTRRFLHAVVDEAAVVMHCKLSALYLHQQTVSQRWKDDANISSLSNTFLALADRLHNVLRHPVQDHTGELLNDYQVLQQSYDKICQLQRLVAKYYPQDLMEVAFAPCKQVGKREFLSSHLKKLSKEQLYQLVCKQLRLCSQQQVEKLEDAQPLLRELLTDHYEIRISQRQAIQQMPLYPTEQQFFETRTIPGEYAQHYSNREDIFPLPIPKLNLQFLSLYDHLLRNFELYGLESAYQIREDIADVVQRMGADFGKEGQVVFRGWARMGVEIKHFTVAQVHQPAVGHDVPSKVLADVVYSVKGMRPEIKAEWDDLKQHDVLYLLSVQPKQSQVQEGTNMNNGDSVQYLRNSLLFARGCEIVEIRDETGQLMNDYSTAAYMKMTGQQENSKQKEGQQDQQLEPEGQLRRLLVALDVAQYQLDVDSMTTDGQDVYKSFNVLMRRKAKENNFKAVLESIRELMNGDCRLPEWFTDIFLGYGDPTSATMQHAEEPLLYQIDFKDTFLDPQHVVDSFPNFNVIFHSQPPPPPPYRIYFPTSFEQFLYKGQLDTHSEQQKLSLKVEGYIPPNPGPYSQDVTNINCVRFTAVQVEAIMCGIQPGLTMVVGPPGTGKTDVACQTLQLLLSNHPEQRALLVAHSNQALNDLFSKIVARDLPARYLLRLGLGEIELDTQHDFSRTGRVNAALIRRIELLAKVQKLAKTLNLPNEASHTCEGAGYFWLTHVLARIERFLDECQQKQGNQSIVKALFPFKEFFADAPQPLFQQQSYEQDYQVALGCIRHLQNIFRELEEIRAFELLRGQADRVNYLMTKQAKIVAMTCTHAALKRAEFLKVGLQYDTLIMEESAQVMEIETLIPMLLQKQTNDDTGKSRLKRIILIGDHGQLPPVIKNRVFQQYSHLDQPLFTRLIRLNVPRITLDAQGRCRPSIAKLFNWRYGGLKDLPAVENENSVFAYSNPGFAFDYQFVDVPDYMGQGEYQPTPFFFQNLGEAEYLVSVYQYMRLLGYPAKKITILTTYNGQKHLIRDVVAKRCEKDPMFGSPQKITTVDKFQGQQNDYILLSLVRTKSVGHIRDIRRLVVACSRARLGFYVFGRESLFSSYGELQPTMELFRTRPLQLSIIPKEFYENLIRPCARPINACAIDKKCFLIPTMESLNPVLTDLRNVRVQNAPLL